MFFAYSTKMIEPCVACTPAATPQYYNSGLKMFFRWPRAGCPSSTMRRSKTSSGLEVWKHMLSAQDSSMVQYRAIRSVGNEPSKTVSKMLTGTEAAGRTFGPNVLNVV